MEHASAGTNGPSAGGDVSEYVSEYVRKYDGNYYIGASRVTLATIVIRWRDVGERPEEIHEGFPTISLAAIYGAIAYYLDHQEAVDAFLQRIEEQARRLQAESEAAHPEFFRQMRERLAKARAAHAESEAAEARGNETAAPAPTETPTI